MVRMVGLSFRRRPSVRKDDSFDPERVELYPTVVDRSLSTKCWDECDHTIAGKLPNNLGHKREWAW